MGSPITLGSFSNMDSDAVGLGTLKLISQCLPGDANGDSTQTHLELPGFSWDSASLKFQSLLAVHSQTFEHLPRLRLGTYFGS